MKTNELKYDNMKGTGHHSADERTKARAEREKRRLQAEDLAKAEERARALKPPPGVPVASRPVAPPRKDD